MTATAVLCVSHIRKLWDEPVLNTRFLFGVQKQDEEIVFLGRLGIQLCTCDPFHAVCGLHETWKRGQ